MSWALIYETSSLPSEKEEGLILDLWMLPKPPLVPVVWEATPAIAEPSPYLGLRTVGRWGRTSSQVRPQKWTHSTTTQGPGHN